MVSMIADWCTTSQYLDSSISKIPHEKKVNLVLLWILVKVYTLTFHFLMSDL